MVTEQEVEMGNTENRLWEPCIEVESSHGVREISLSTAHLMNRIVFLRGEIDSAMADGFHSRQQDEDHHDLYRKGGQYGRAPSCGRAERTEAHTSTQ